MEGSWKEYKAMQHKVKRKVAKAKQKAYSELYEKVDTMEGEKDLSSGEAEGLSLKGCSAGSGWLRTGMGM